MAERLREKQDAFTVGREGIKLPALDDLRLKVNFDVLVAMRKLWEMNGFDVTTEGSYNGREYPARRFSYEHVLPATNDKSLAVLRAAYEPRDRLSIEAEAQYRRGDMDSTVTIGTESYGLYTTPETAGPFVPLLVTRYTHKRGGSIGWSGPYAEVEWLGETMGHLRLRMPHYPEWPADKQYEADDAAYAMRLRWMAEKTVEFLS